MYLYLYLSTFKGTCILLKYSKNNAMYLYFNKCESTCTLLKYFHMYFAPCLLDTSNHKITLEDHNSLELPDKYCIATVVELLFKRILVLRVNNGKLLNIIHNYVLTYSQQQVSQIDHEMIQITALKMVFDILLLYGMEMFRTTGDSGKDDDDDDDDDNDETEGDEDIMADLSFSDEAVDKRQDGDEATHKLLKILLEFLDHEV